MYTVCIIDENGAITKHDNSPSVVWNIFKDARHLPGVIVAVFFDNSIIAIDESRKPWKF